MTAPARTVFVTGAHRGLGYAVAKLAAERGFDVVASVRREEDLNTIDTLALALRSEGALGSLRGVVLDVTQIQSMPEDTWAALEATDILINNAGWGADLSELDQEQPSVLSMDPRIFEKALLVNAEGPRLVMAVAIPGMRTRGWGRVVNVSSILAGLGVVIGERTAPAYRLSKLVLNGVTAIAAHETKGSGVLINALCPGWCQTDMGGPMATDTVERGAERILALAELPDDGPSGQYFIDGQPSAF